MKIEIRVVLRQLGLVLFVLSAAIAMVALFAGSERLSGAAARGSDFSALLLSALAGAAVGGLFFLSGRRGASLLGQREALLLVATSWVAAAALCALPFRLWSAMRLEAASTPHDFDAYVNCYFEAMSGLTTTGATVVQTISSLPRSLLLWRALTHWLGGLGIVVLFVAVLPMLGVGSRRIYRLEVPGPSPDGVKPRIHEAARILWLIYSGLTLAEILALRVCGMSWFDATCHTFATLATGGFSTQDASVTAYASTTIHVVIIVFMILAGVNFALYHLLYQRRWRAVLKNAELRAYLGIMFVAVVIVALSIHQQAPGAAGDSIGVGETVRDAMFQVVSIQTTTGFTTADFDRWGFAAKITLVILMFVGASSGSTGGGIKVVRVVTAVKLLWAEIEHAYRPQVVRPVKVGRTLIDADMKLNTAIYVLSIALVFAMGAVLLMLLEGSERIDITTAATASAATLNNIGPGLAKVGATRNYAWFCEGSKIVMSALMLLGRLELFTVIALLSPKFWREE